MRRGGRGAGASLRGLCEAERVTGSWVARSPPPRCLAAAMLLCCSGLSRCRHMTAICRLTLSAPRVHVQLPNDNIERAKNDLRSALRLEPNNGQLWAGGVARGAWRGKGAERLPSVALVACGMP